MITFNQGTMESILTSCITLWGESCTDYNRRTLQRMVTTAGRIIGTQLPSLEDIYTNPLTHKANTIVSDASHPAHNLLSVLPSGKRYGGLCFRTTRLTNSFFQQAVRMLNSLPSWRGNLKNTTLTKEMHSGIWPPWHIQMFALRHVHTPAAITDCLCNPTTKKGQTFWMYFFTSHMALLFLHQLLLQSVFVFHIKIYNLFIY